MPPVSKNSFLFSIALLFAMFVLVQCDTVNPYTSAEPDEAQLREAADFMLWFRPNADADVMAGGAEEIAKMFFQIRQRYAVRDGRLAERFALPWNPRTIFVQLNIANLNHYNATGELPWNEESGVLLPERIQKFNVGVEFFALSYNHDFNPHLFCREWIAVEGVARCEPSYSVYQPGTIAPVIVQEKGTDHLVIWFTGRQPSSENFARIEVENGIYRFSEVKMNEVLRNQLTNEFRSRGGTGSPREI